MKKLQLGRYDYASYSAFTAYAICSLLIPVLLVDMGHDLSFPLDKGGMGAGGVLHMVRSISMLAALALCGIIASRFGKRVTMGVCMILAGTGIFLCGFASVYWILIPLLAIAGLGEGYCEGIATPFVQGLHPDEPEKYVNIAHSFWSVGIGICVLGAGAMLTSGVPWRIIISFGGLLSIASGILFLWRENPQKKYPETPSGHKHNVWENSIKIFKRPRFWVYCAAMFTGAGAEFCLTFWAATYLQLNFQASAFTAGIGTAAIAAGMFAGRNFFGMTAGPDNLKKILLGCSLGTIPLTLALVFISPEIFSSRIMLLGALSLLLFLCGIGIAPYWPTLQVLGVRNLPEYDDTLLYIYFSAMGIPGCGFFTWLVGILGDKYGLQGAFCLIPATLLLYGAIILWDGWIYPVKKRK